jgi:hypothetical protein
VDISEEFIKFPSITRLSKEKMIITEKIDGSNAGILIIPDEQASGGTAITRVQGADSSFYWIYAQSRSRFVTPDDDNFGFAKWVHKNANGLVDTLGVGRHMGEWWGSGIQRNYGLSEKRFSLFNAPRWHESISYLFATTSVPELRTVPLLYAGRFDLDRLSLAKEQISEGSVASPTFKGGAEGVVMYLREANVSYKILLENDDIHKWEVAK